MSHKTILQPGKNCLTISKVEETGLLIDGRNYFRAFYWAAQAAERYILLSGWQFDSYFHLLRGEDAKAAAGETRFLPFLNSLCDNNPDLRIFMLAWDFSMIYGLDREWFQELYFNWTTNERLQFCFDRCSSFDASHHQKYVVIDGKFAFVGGLDLCAARWDERDHRVQNPYRVESGDTPYRSFHDVQSYHAGPFAAKLAELFKARWKVARCEDLELPATGEAARPAIEPNVTLQAKEVAISRTQTEASCSEKSVYEIRALFADAIAAAERLIYIENQYFSSEALFDALAARMKAAERPKLEIVLMIAKDAEAFLEQLSIGIMQSRLIGRLREIARDTGHHLGIYYPASRAASGEELETYIHSKLLLVDDRFLSVGSANMNNRSLGYDTELNVAWEGKDGDDLSTSIRDARINLLAEHTGFGIEACQNLAMPGLVRNLNRLADSGASRLRHHPQRSVADEYGWLTSIFPDGLPFDPRGPITNEIPSDTTPGAEGSFFTRGITELKNWLLGEPGSGGQTVAPPEQK
ncbi:MAG TPA: phospholipase D-like domain-containing protein [Candidatus Binatia bacterium]|nr:phospholipase D-like domain-containing protein [Candidatus Binatia bacterium]